jgi:iron complex outermembrane receptor protein
LGYAVVATSSAWAEEVIEEVVVLGSYIKRAPEDAPSPVRVIGREEMEAAGRPQLADYVMTLPSVVGSENVTAQEQNVAGAGAANINIRNLGLSSTLVLINGKRLNVGTSVSNQGENFVDINRLPSIMIENVEILKDGASATYGSDAVAGVANFKLRDRFEGFEIQGFYQDSFKGNEVSFNKVGLPEIYRPVIEARSKDTYSDLDLGAIWGFGNDKTHFVIGANYFKRDPLESVDRQFAINDIADDSVGLPSPFNLPQDMFGSVILAPGLEIPGAALINDSSCVALGHYRTRNSGLCSTKLDLLSRDIFSKEERRQLLATFTHDLSDRVEIYGHFGGSETDVRINQSPSFPITSQVPFSSANPGFQFEVLNGFQSLLTTGTAPFGDDVNNRLASLLAGQPYPLPVLPFVPPELGGPNPLDPFAILSQVGTLTFNGVMRPSLLHLAQIAGVPADVDGDGVVEEGEIFRNRNQSTIDRETRVFMIGARGDLNDTWSFDTSFNYSSEKSITVFYDTVTDRLSDALNGWFGLGCDKDAYGPGEGPCTWFNPFGSSMLLPDVVFPDGNGNLHTLGNDAAAVHALEGEGVATARSSLIVVDAIMSTNEFFGWELGGGGVGFAIGAQYRKEEYKAGGNELATDPSFPFAFTGPAIPFDADQDIWAIFTEFALPITEDLEFQLALRYENYGEQTGDTLDPKVAFRWQAADSLVLRASAGTSFRGPSLVQKFGTGTGLEFILPPPPEVVAANVPGQTFGSGVFARLPTYGNPGLQPEESVNFNIGVIWSPNENLSISLDYFNYDYEDVIVPDDFRGLANDCQINWGLAGRPVPQNVDGSFNADYLAVEACNFLDLDGDPGTPDIFLDTQGNPLTVQRSYVNGTDVENSGLDILARYTIPTDVGTFGATLDFAWFIDYKINRAVTPFDTRLEPGEKVDLVGVSENVLVGRPLPEFKGTLLLDYSNQQHYATALIHYVSDVTEPNSFPPNRKVKDHATVDLAYTYSFWKANLSLTVGAVNIFDEDPPTAQGFNSFESTIHDPRGRLWYFRARYGL